jgi:putative flavoprotein involved in K+ transport
MRRRCSMAGPRQSSRDRRRDRRRGRVLRGRPRGNLAWADDQTRPLLLEIDAVVERQGLQARPADQPVGLQTDDGAPEAAPASIDLHLGVGSVMWATGYRPAFDRIALPFTDGGGHPIQRRGVTEIPGLYVLGLDWLHSAKSGLFAGIDEDATFLASAIAATR